MGKIIDINDIVGKKFDKLTVLNYVGKEGSNYFYTCQCECGNTIIAKRCNLIRGATKSCGCVNRIDATDIIGKKFGRLLVLSIAGKRRSNYCYNCKCDCGNEKVVNRYALLHGTIQSCGCLHLEKSSIDKSDIIGKKFGRWTVLSYAYFKNNKHYYNCRCECGTTRAVSRVALIGGKTKSCGCLCREVTSATIKKDMIGKKFNKLTVIAEVGKTNYGALLYRCRCDCGNEKIVPGQSLRNSTIKSCGCIIKDVAKERRGKPCANRKDLTGQRFGKLVVLGFSGRKGNADGVGEGMRFICRCDCGNICEVVSGHLRDGGVTSCGCVAKELYTKLFDEHREDVKVDNTDLDRLNSRNTKANTSGRKGVRWRKERNCWQAYIKFQGKVHYKNCKTFEEAVAARESMEEEYWEPTLKKYGRELK